MKRLSLPITKPTLDEKMQERDKILVAVLGLDQPGIVAASAETLGRLDCHIEELTQSTLAEQYAAILVANKPAELKSENIKLELEGAFHAKKFHLSVTIRDFEEPADDMHFGMGQPFVLSVWGPDRNDIVATFSRICAEQRINVTSLRAFPIENDESLQVFEITVPDSVDTRSLQRIMSERARSMGLHLNMQHRAIFEEIHRVQIA